LVARSSVSRTAGPSIDDPTVGESGAGQRSACLTAAAKVLTLLR
jgi:hypothetical protein